jgi:hypothetical protein
MIDAQGATLDPSVKAMLGGVNGEDVNARLAELGVTPADMLQRIMGEPELAAAIQKPKVMQAIMEMQTNPMAFMDYQVGRGRGGGRVEAREGGVAGE